MGSELGGGSEKPGSANYKPVLANKGLKNCDWVCLNKLSHLEGSIAVMTSSIQMRCCSIIKLVQLLKPAKRASDVGQWLSGCY